MKLLFEDRDIAVCVKPFGTLSEGEGDNALPTMLAAQLGGEIFPVHRLDRETGGCMVYARRGAAASKLSAAVSERRMEKEYLAVVQGCPAEKSATLKDLLFRDAAKNKSFVVDRARRGVREAELSYELLETVQTEQGELSLVRVKLVTGRTHQIRVQFSHRKHPVVGDQRYGSRLKPPHMALWSWRLEFPHPFKKQRVTVSALPPQEWPWTLFSLPEE